MLGGRKRMPSEMPSGSRNPTDCVSRSRVGKNSRLRSLGYSIAPGFIVGFMLALPPLPPVGERQGERQYTGRAKNPARNITMEGLRLKHDGTAAPGQSRPAPPKLRAPATHSRTRRPHK